MNLLDPSFIAELYHQHYFLFALGVFVGAMLVTYYLIPKVIWVVRAKNLMKGVNDRSAHTVDTPSFGGVAFYVSFILAMSSLQAIGNKAIGANLIAAVTVLFMVGLKDDLVVSTPRAKLVGQLIATAFIVFYPRLEITNLYGFLGLHEIPVYVGYVIATFITIALINAYNLIDGINGLAAIIGMVITLSYALAFYALDMPFFVLICLMVAGILLAFLRFNCASLKKRIFMGDSGSLIIGLILAFLTLRFLAVPAAVVDLQEVPWMQYRWLLVIAILFIPLFDTSRVMICRLLNHKSMFSADRNHTHHVLLDKGLSHPMASVVLGIVNLLVVLVMVNLILFFPNTPWLLYMGAILIYFIAYMGVYCTKKSVKSAQVNEVI